MKKQILLFALMINSILSFAQTTLFSDSFNRMSLGSDWTNSGLTVSLNGSDMTLSGGSAQTKYVKYTAWGTCLENWQIVCNFKVITQNATSQGLGIGIKTASAFGNKSIVCQFAHGTGTGSKGKTYILAGTTAPSTFTQMAVTSAQVVQVNDEIRLTVTRSGQTITAYTENLTRSTNTTATYTFSFLYTSSVFMHNSGYPYIVNASGTQNVHDFTFTTTENDSTDVMFLGDSQTHGVSLDSVYKRYANRVMDTSSKSYVVSAGGGDYTAGVLSKIKELCWFKPKYVLIMVGGNDIAFGISAATYRANYQSFVQTLKDSGSVVIHCLAPPRNSYNMTTLNNWIVSTYTGIDSIVDAYTPLWSGTGTGLNVTYDCGDGSHGNNAWNILVQQTIDNSVGAIIK